MSHGLRFIQDTIRRLARRYGLPISVYNTTSSVTRDTGVKTRTLTSVDIARALVLESKGVTETTSDLLKLLTVSAVATSGQYAIADRTIVFLYQDLKGFPITTESYIVFENQKWEVAELSKYENDQIYAVRARRTVGEIPGQIRNKVRDAFIVIGQTVEVTHVQS